ncbi:adenylate/guanylate cyclase domain-containing protein [Zunongwangia sp.]|uniref:adenylate/guanylate cyclase domain-containing protein n=1 Tax=Zunongwangia sp. TaxID=1965325 RepID=UPI003AA9714B
MKQLYYSNFYSFFNAHPILGKILKQIVFWIISYGLLFVIIHFTALSVLKTMEAEPINLSICGLLSLFILLGVVLGVTLGFLDTVLKDHLLKNRSLGSNILIGGIAYFAVLIIIILFIRFIVLQYSSENFLNSYTRDIIRLNWKYYNVIILSYTLFMTLILSFITQMTSKFGPGLILPFLLGKFRYPREENRLFMFLDLNNSTQLAEQLGHIKYSGFIQESFMDINQVVKKYNAEIYQYVGDEIVLSWPLKRFETSVAIKFFFAVNKRFKDRKESYLKNYNSIPIFKAGVHQGLVTAVEVGEVKREIAYHGDVLNVASRIEGLCKTFNKRILVSKEIQQNKSIQNEFNINSLGNQKLEGRKESVEVFSVEEIEMQ